MNTLREALADMANAYDNGWRPETVKHLDVAREIRLILAAYPEDPTPEAVA